MFLYIKTHVVDECETSTTDLRTETTMFTRVDLIFDRLANALRQVHSESYNETYMLAMSNIGRRHGNDRYT